MADEKLFEFLNHDCGPVIDAIMMGITSAWIWIPFYVLALWFVWRKHEKEGWRSEWLAVVLFILCWAIVVALADVVCGIFK